MQKRNLEQRCATKFWVKLKENATETYEKLKLAHREHAVSRAQVFRCHKAILDGREFLEGKPRSGRNCMLKTDENVTKVRDPVRSDRSWTVRMIVTIMRSLNNSEQGFILSGQRLRTLGYCITTSLPVTLPLPLTNLFFTKKGIPVVKQPHTCLIWVRVTYSFSRDSNSTSKVVILELWTTTKRSWQTSWGHIHMKTATTSTVSGSKCLRRRVASQGNYFEGDNVDL